MSRTEIRPLYRCDWFFTAVGDVDSGAVFAAFAFIDAVRNTHLERIVFAVDSNISRVIFPLLPVGEAGPYY